MIGDGISTSKSDPFARWMTRIVFVLCHQFQGLVEVGMELYTQKEYFLIHLHHLLHLRDREHVAFVVVWAMTGAARTSDLEYKPYFYFFFGHSMFIPPPQELLIAPTKKTASNSSST